MTSSSTEVAFGSLLSRVRLALPLSTFLIRIIFLLPQLALWLDDVKHVLVQRFDGFATFCSKSTNKSRCRCFVVTWINIYVFFASLMKKNFLSTMMMVTRSGLE